ncbi:putative Dihydrofolate synthetase [Seiridium unicorne]|uniref:Dihydrofolate synthetase n=1 Tax=Seiridium unicorne TaxID=138068 RepID=A0ABR2V462_9PEZI
MIELGLARIQKLLQKTPQTWKAVHVAGTNGKGSICAYLTAMLRANNISCAKFTSPHLIDRWDCISINDTAVSETKFRQFEDLVRQRNEEWQINASEFELLTATAFEIFEAERVEVGVVEVGLGGRLDATNVLKHKAITVISKIGLDHQSFLGNTLSEIALQKAGIMRQDVPCVVDASNPISVLDVFRVHSQEVGSHLKITSLESSDIARSLKDDLEPHQAQNLAVAHEAFRTAFPQYAHTAEVVTPAIRNMSWPGRLQLLDIKAVTGRQQSVLLDGAHNHQSAEALAGYVNRHFRAGGEPKPVTWILAASQGKDLTEIIKSLIHQGDFVVAVEFGPVDGMPWVKPMSAETILSAVARSSTSSQHNSKENLQDALQWASHIADGGPLVIAGSLYLVSDVMRLLRSAT